LVNDVVPHLPSQGILKVVDFGCGKSYLTFALHHLLREIHQRDVRIVGLDRKSSVVRDCQSIAKRLNCVGLEFREGDIWNHQEDQIHLAVSLHACDTATDEALAKAVAWQADVILAVPCCQHEIAAMLPPEILPTIQQHGILKDRLAAIFTDSLRSAALESLGYKTQVVEFIEMEHTAKNVLIRAIRRTTSTSALNEAQQKYHQLKTEMGIEEFHLDKALEQLQIVL
ncbi:MAG: SAM-dependent methyltransferase, partial [Planctomycetaceae bacterium]|nr:SAM-dependent methyltransferase [Planctomycetaceae bacterium]